MPVGLFQLRIVSDSVVPEQFPGKTGVNKYEVNTADNTSAVLYGYIEESCTLSFNVI